jgi:hypothetical protein
VSSYLRHLQIIQGGNSASFITPAQTSVIIIASFRATALTKVTINGLIRSIGGRFRQLRASFCRADSNRGLIASFS